MLEIISTRKQGLKLFKEMWERDMEPAQLTFCPIWLLPLDFTFTFTDGSFISVRASSRLW